MFLARAESHWSTGQMLSRIADDLGIAEYSHDIQPLVDRTVEAGRPVSAPRTTRQPPPISWA